MKDRIIVAVDLDGVTADYFGAMRPIAARWLGVGESALSADVNYDFKSWGSDKWPGGFSALHKYAVTKEGLFSSLPPIPGAAQTLRRLSEEDFRIRIVTFRLCMKWHHATAITQTVSWLEKHDIPYWDICFLADKTDINADVFIDDSPSNYKRLKEAGKNVWLYRQGWNSHILTPDAVSSWGEIYERLKRMKNERNTD